MKYYDNVIDIQVSTDKQFEYLKTWLVSKADSTEAAQSISEAIFSHEDDDDVVVDFTGENLSFVFDGNEFHGEPSEICIEPRQISLYACSRSICGLSAVHAVQKELGRIATVAGRVVSDDGSIEAHWYYNGMVASVPDLIEESWELDEETGEEVQTDVGRRLETIFGLARDDYKRDFEGDEENPMPDVKGVAQLWERLHDSVDEDPEYSSSWHYLGEKVENEFRCLEVSELLHEGVWRKYEKS